MPDHTVLAVNFERNLPEYVPVNPIAQILFQDGTTVRKMVEALHRAAGGRARGGAPGQGGQQRYGPCPASGIARRRAGFP